MKVPDKKINIELRNFQDTPWRDIYHKWLNLSWPRSFLVFGLAYFGVNVFFALLFYALGPEAIENSDGSFLSALFFSIQTLSTIGYGKLAPVTTAANILVMFEAAIGMVIIALLSGLFIGKMSLARARIIFTRKMLVAQHHGKKTLQLRIANVRANRIIDAKITLMLLKPDISPEGMRMRKSYELPLELSHAPIFAMTLTAIHDLDTGALKDYDLDAMCDAGLEFIITIVGTDGTLGQTIYASNVYTGEDIVKAGSWGHIGEILPDGRRVVDLKNFDVINPA